MDGRVLHFDEAEDRGLIRGSDGARYPFAGEDWRSPEPPAAGDGVDFELDSGRATEIFRVAPAAAAAPARPREDTATFLKRRPALLLAIVMLLGCVLPFVSVPFYSISLFTLPGTVSFFVNVAGALGGEAAPGLAGIRTAAWSLYLLYLIPAAAGWLVIRELAGGAPRRLSLAVGIVALATPFVTAILSSALARSSVERPAATGAPKADIPSPPEAVLQLLSYIGIGWMLIILAGAGLIAIGCGWSPFGGAARRD